MTQFLKPAAKLLKLKSFQTLTFFVIKEMDGCIRWPCGNFLAAAITQSVPTFEIPSQDRWCIKYKKHRQSNFRPIVAVYNFFLDQTKRLDLWIIAPSACPPNKFWK